MDAIVADVVPPLPMNRCYFLGSLRLEKRFVITECGGVLYTNSRHGPWDSNRTMAGPFPRTNLFHPRRVICASMPRPISKRALPVQKRQDEGDAGQKKLGEEGDRQRAWLPEAPLVQKPRAVHNAAALAYMGDAIFELYVRRHFLTPPQTMDKYNQRVMALVRCEAQFTKWVFLGEIEEYRKHALLQKLVKLDVFTAEERDILRWGRNIDAGNKGARRRAGGTVYNSASSLETLIGYLYLTNVERLGELMTQMGFDAENSEVVVLPQDSK